MALALRGSQLHLTTHLTQGTKHEARLRSWGHEVCVPTSLHRAKGRLRRRAMRVRFMDVADASRYRKDDAKGHDIMSWIVYEKGYVSE